MFSVNMNRYGALVQKSVLFRQSDIVFVFVYHLHP